MWVGSFMYNHIMSYFLDNLLKIREFEKWMFPLEFGTIHPFANITTVPSMISLNGLFILHYCTMHIITLKLSQSTIRVGREIYGLNQLFYSYWFILELKAVLSFLIPCQRKKFCFCFL